MTRIVTKYKIYKLDNGLLLPYKLLRFSIDTTGQEYNTHQEAEEYCDTYGMAGAVILPVTQAIWVGDDDHRS